MRAAVEYVADHSGCTKREVSLAVGPHGSNAYGYRIVMRAIRAGLIRDISLRRKSFLIESHTVLSRLRAERAEVR